MACGVVEGLARDFDRQSFTVQSTELVRKRSEESTEPLVVWKCRPNWACMGFVHIVLVQPSFGSCSIVPIGLIDISFFCTDPKGRRLVIGEVHGGNCNFPSLIMSGMYEFLGFLLKEITKRNEKHKIVSCLWLGKHIHQPTADCAVRAAGDEIVRILGSDHLHRVDGMCVSRGRQWGFKHREVLRTVIPQKDLTRIRATKNKIGVEG